MPVLVGKPFASTFSFGRPTAAPRLNAAGAIETMAIDQPRFDHDGDGNRLGLLIEAGAAFGQQDQLVPIADDWVEALQVTVLVEWRDSDGVVRRRASYTTEPVAAVNAALSIVGHVRLIGAVPGYLANRAKPGEPGYVRYRSLNWGLGGALTVAEGLALGDGSGRAMIESA